MKWTAFIIVAAAAGFVPDFVRGAPASDLNPAGQIREEFGPRRGKELRRIRGKVDTTARQLPPADRVRFGPIYDALSTAEQTLVECRGASDSEAPQIRRRLEMATSKVLRLWNELQAQALPSTAKRG